METLGGHNSRTMVWCWSDPPKLWEVHRISDLPTKWSRIGNLLIRWTDLHLGSRPPRSRLHKLYFLLLEKRSELSCKGHEIFVREQVLPKLASFGVVAEVPQMDELMERPCVRDKITDEEFGVSSGFESWPSFIGIQLKNFAHLTHVHVVRAPLVKLEFSHNGTLVRQT